MPGVEPDPPRCKRGALPVELHPRGDAGRVESNHHSQRRWRYRPVSSPMLSVRLKGWPAGLEPASPGSRPGMFASIPRPQRGRPGVDPPAASRLTSERSGRLSYAPIGSRAGGIRTHGLELMRLARTTAPLPRKVWLAGLEPAIPGFQGRWGGQLPHSQMTNVTTASPESTATLVGDPGLLPRLLPRGTGVAPYREVDQHVVADREHPRRDSNPQPPG